MRMALLAAVFLSLTVCPLTNDARPSQCQDGDYQGDEIQRAFEALFQKTGITFSGYTTYKTLKPDCTEQRSLRELVANLIVADAQNRLKLREAAKLIASNYLSLQKSAVTGEMPYKTFLEIAAFLYKSDEDKHIEPSSPLPNYLQQSIDVQAKIYTLEFCGGTHLADCPN